MLKRSGRVGLAMFAATGVALVVAGTASAHVGVDKAEVEAGSSTALTFSFGHGCEGSPTNSLKFQVPAGVNDAKPQAHAGWTIDVEREDLAQPEESAHGEAVTDRPSVITFTAQPGFEIPNDVRDSLSINFTAPEAEGELFFKVVQGCETGENAWIDEWDGTGAEPEHPAPSVMVVAASGDGDSSGHHAEEGTDTTVADADHHGEEVAATTVAVGSDDDSSDDSSNGLAITGIVVGGLGLVTGGAALARSGRKSA